MKEGGYPPVDRVGSLNSRTFEFVAENTSEKFYKTTYRNYHAKLLIERERSLLPGTQPLVVRKKQQRERDDKVKELLAENAMLQQLIKDNKEKRRNY